MALLGRGWLAVCAAALLLPAPVQAIRKVQNAKAAPHVFIHHIVGLTYSYGAAEWERDMIEAQSNGIEAFALNLGTGSWEVERVREAYRVASTSSSVQGFKLFLSLDMNHFSTHFSDEGRKEAVVNLLNEFAGHPSNFQYEGRGFVSTFSGGTETFGEASADAGWQWIRDNSKPAIYFVPNFFISPQQVSQFSSIDGFFKWKAWQYHSYGDRNQPGYTDADFQKALGSKTYMAPVSPCFFTHYDANSWNKNWYFGGDDHLLVTRWEEMMGDTQPEFVEIITYNDFGESHYMTSPVGRAAPRDTPWIEGFDHTPWLHLSALYSHAFRNHGTFPAIEDDKLYIYYRPHSKNAAAFNDSQGLPEEADKAVDSVYAVAVLKAAGEVVISNGARSVSTTVGPGITKLELPNFVPGGVAVELRRAGGRIVCGTGMDIVESPALYNFNYYVAEFPQSGMPACAPAQPPAPAPCHTLWSDPASCCSSRDDREAYHMQECVSTPGSCQPSGFLSPEDWQNVPETCLPADGVNAPCYALWKHPDLCCASRDNRTEYHMQECVHTSGSCQPTSLLGPDDWQHVPETCLPADGVNAPCHLLWKHPDLCCASRDNRTEYHMQECVYTSGSCQPTSLLGPDDWPKVHESCLPAGVMQHKVS